MKTWSQQILWNMFDQPSTTFANFVIAMLVFYTVYKAYLMYRQSTCVIKNRGTVPSDFVGHVSLSEHQKAADYTIEKLKLNAMDLVLQIVLLLLWTFGGVLNAFNQVLIHFFPSGVLLQQLLLVIVFMVVNGIISLPLSLYTIFGVEQSFGFNQTTWHLWLSDQIKGMLIAAIVGVPILALILWIMQAAGNYWWLLAFFVLVAINLIAMVIYPLFIAPLFNKFTKLDDPKLLDRTTKLMTRCGFRAKGFFVMDGSRRSKHANAYFTGFGASKRVVFYDTLLKELSMDEIEAVLAHELGHFKHKHLLKTMLSMFILSFVGFACLGYFSQSPWFYIAMGMTFEPAVHQNGVALILFLLLAPIAGFFLFTPRLSRLSRKYEFEADAFAAHNTNPTMLAQALIKLCRDNASTLTPDSLYAHVYYSHPTVSERLANLARCANQPASSS